MLAAHTRTRTSRGPLVGSGTWAARRPLLPYFSTTNAFITDRLLCDGFCALGGGRCYAAVSTSPLLDVFQFHSAASAQTLARRINWLNKARVVLKPNVEPVVLRLEYD